MNSYCKEGDSRLEQSSMATPSETYLLYVLWLVLICLQILVTIVTRSLLTIHNSFRKAKCTRMESLVSWSWHSQNRTRVFRTERQCFVRYSTNFASARMNSISRSGAEEPGNEVNCTCDKNSCLDFEPRMHQNIFISQMIWRISSNINTFVSFPDLGDPASKAR